MKDIPATVFTLGRERGEDGETPSLEVSVAAFSIDQREVTVDEYLSCVEAAACSRPPQVDAWCNLERDGALQHPANCVTLDEASEYCSWQGKRLPTEAEWELAARGSAADRKYPWGDEPPRDRACYDRLRSKMGSCKVTDTPADQSPFGVLNMGGNVAEWTRTPYCHQGGSKCEPELFVTRGGSWDMVNPVFVRTTHRDFVARGERGFDLGFRCAKDG